MGGVDRDVRRSRRARRATAWCSRPCSRTSGSSSGSAPGPTWSARRCTTSRTRAAAASHCAPRGPPRSCGRSCSIVRRRRGRSGTRRPTSATNGHRPAASASTTSSASKRSAPRIPTSTWRCSRWPGTTWPRSACVACSCSSTRWAPGRTERRSSSRCAPGWPREPGELDPADRDKVADHPMRVLDSKRPTTQAVVVDAPRITEHLSPSSRAHFERVQEGLDELGVPYTSNPRLVRGLDYYTHTTFEFVADVARRRAEHRARWRPLRRSRGRDGRSRDRGHRLRLGYRAGAARVRRRGRVRRARSTRRRLRRRHHRRRPGAHLTTELRRAGLRVDRAFDQRSMRARDEGRRPLRCTTRRDHRRARAGRRDRGPASPAWVGRRGRWRPGGRRRGRTSSAALHEALSRPAPDDPTD